MEGEGQKEEMRMSERVDGQRCAYRSGHETAAVLFPGFANS